MRSQMTSQAHTECSLRLTSNRQTHIWELAKKGSKHCCVIASTAAESNFLYLLTGLKESLLTLEHIY